MNPLLAGIDWWSVAVAAAIGAFAVGAATLIAHRIRPRWLRGIAWIPLALGLSYGARHVLNFAMAQ